MENIFIENTTSVDVAELSRKKEFMLSIARQLREAYSNIAYFRIKDEQTFTRIEFGRYAHGSATHEFNDEGGQVKYKSHGILTYTRERLNKIQDHNSHNNSVKHNSLKKLEVFEKYPHSYCCDKSDFTPMVFVIPLGDDDTLNERIRDVITILEADGYVVNR